MLPNTRPRAFTGAPRNERIGGWFGGNPYDRGSREISGRRRVLASLISTPRIPRPTGGWPMRARSDGSMPTVMNSVISPSGPSTPRAPYRASVSDIARATIRCRTASSDSSEASVRPACSSASVRSAGASGKSATKRNGTGRLPPVCQRSRTGSSGCRGDEPGQPRAVVRHVGERDRGMLARHRIGTGRVALHGEVVEPAALAEHVELLGQVRTIAPRAAAFTLARGEVVGAARTPPKFLPPGHRIPPPSRTGPLRPPRPPAPPR